MFLLSKITCWREILLRERQTHLQRLHEVKMYIVFSWCPSPLVIIISHNLFFDKLLYQILYSAISCLVFVIFVRFWNNFSCFFFYIYMIIIWLNLYIHLPWVILSQSRFFSCPLSQNISQEISWNFTQLKSDKILLVFRASHPKKD